jgi:hypothetical protein
MRPRFRVLLGRAARRAPWSDVTSLHPLPPSHGFLETLRRFARGEFNEPRPPG